jgi:hypothetical protein
MDVHKSVSYAEKLVSAHKLENRNRFPHPLRCRASYSNFLFRYFIFNPISKQSFDVSYAPTLWPICLAWVAPPLRPLALARATFSRHAAPCPPHRSLDRSCMFAWATRTTPPIEARVQSVDKKDKSALVFVLALANFFYFFKPQILDHGNRVRSEGQTVASIWNRIGKNTKLKNRGGSKITIRVQNRGRNIITANWYQWLLPDQPPNQFVEGLSSGI